MYNILFTAILVKFIVPVTGRFLEQWSTWSVCSKTCDIGIRTRERINNVTNTVIQQQYCNLRYCPDNWKNCTESDWICDGISDGRGTCIDNKCVCDLGYGYNRYNCNPEFGNCIIRMEPESALGFKDPMQSFYNDYKLRSCTTDDNSIFDVHVIGIYGDRIRNQYTIKILPRAPVYKPIVLILSSYHTTYWQIDSSVGIYRILYGGYFQSDSKVCSLNGCKIPKPIKRPDFPAADGSDTGGGDTIRLLRIISNEYGPITSFTGYYSLETFGSSRIILKVGGNPLSVIPRNHVDKLSMNCSPIEPPVSYTLQAVATVHYTTNGLTTVKLDVLNTTTTNEGLVEIVIGSVITTVVVICIVLGLCIFVFTRCKLNGSSSWASELQNTQFTQHQGVSRPSYLQTSYLTNDTATERTSETSPTRNEPCDTSTTAQSDYLPPSYDSLQNQEYESPPSYLSVMQTLNSITK